MKSSRDRKYFEEKPASGDSLLISGRKPVLEVLRRGLAMTVEISEGAHGKVIDEIRAEARRRGIDVAPPPSPPRKQGGKPGVRGEIHPPLTAPAKARGGTSEKPAEAGGEGRLQGVQALIRMPEVRGDVERLEKLVGREPAPLLLMLDGIEDPANFGAILRTAYGAGVDGVVFRERRQAPLNEVVFKTSAGCAALIDLYQVTNLDQAVRRFQQMGYWIAAAQGGDDAADYTRLDWRRPTVLIMGSEGRGVSDLLLKRADHQVQIPMYAPLDSLNVGAATAVLLFEAARQRGLTSVSVE